MDGFKMQQLRRNNNKEISQSKLTIYGYVNTFAHFVNQVMLQLRKNAFKHGTYWSHPIGHNYFKYFKFQG